MRNEITKLFEEVGEHYKTKGVARLLELNQGNDVHAFYRLSQSPSKVIHVQGYPGLSNEEKARVFARVMDYNEMMKIRKRKNVSIGNEHQATVQFLPNFNMGILIPYDSETLEEELAMNIPELRL